MNFFEYLRIERNRYAASIKSTPGVLPPSLSTMNPFNSFNITRYLFDKGMRETNWITKNDLCVDHLYILYKEKDIVPYPRL